MISNPNKPNPDQLQHIHPKNSPRNPARYEAAPAEGEQELKTEGPTIVLHPNAVYLVNPEEAAERREDLEEAVGGQEPAGPLLLTSLDPDELPVWASDSEVLFRGENFTDRLQDHLERGRRANHLYRRANTFNDHQALDSPSPPALYGRGLRG